MKLAARDAPLGVFDSGLGGLTVVRALARLLPHEDIVYLGDTARVPYGTKGADTIRRYSMGCAKHLLRDDVKAIVVACNTASAVAPELLRAAFDVPVFSVIDPGAQAAVEASVTGRIGVLATQGTVASGAYPRAVSTVSTRAETFAFAAPLLVPLAEEGWLEGDVPRLAVRRYLEPLRIHDVDVLVLGCTHYPLLLSVFEEETRALLGPAVTVVDSAHATAESTRRALAERGLLAEGRTRPGRIEISVTDRSPSFSVVAARFLGASPGEPRLVDL